MKDRILQTLSDLRSYALTKGAAVALFYHEEDSYLMRFANSAISLNTNEHLIRLEITAFEGPRKAAYSMITNLDEIDEMKRGIDTAAEMVRHAQPLTYTPTAPHFTETFSDESGYDPELGNLSSDACVAYFNQAAAGLETDDLRLSGIFSHGTNTLAQISTQSDHTQYFKTTDAQVTAVLAHSRLKWEVNAEQSAWQQRDLNPAPLRQTLGLLVEQYQTAAPVQLPIGRYDVVFGPAAICTMVEFLTYIGFNGGMMKRGYSFLAEKDIERRVFSPLFTLADDPSLPQTFPLRHDFYGMPRAPFALFEQGVFKGFTWDQDDADEFSQKPTGHSIPNLSLALTTGSQPTNSLAELLALPRENDLLYVPFLHYTNIVNPSQGLFTGSSRFGALLLKAGGGVQVPYNVRLTQTLPDVFGERVAWIASQNTAYNTSHSYGARSPVAVVTPALMRVNDLEISHSNSSY